MERQMKLRKNTIPILYAPLLVLIGCSSPTPNGGGGESSNTQSTTNETSWGDDAVSGGRYKHGVYFCCGRGEVVETCCEGKDVGTCFQYGGVSGECIGQGELIEGKDICSMCCPGLKAISTATPNPSNRAHDGYQLPDGCTEIAPPSLGMCSACGNGICDKDESFCNCPDDCKKGDSTG